MKQETRSILITTIYAVLMVSICIFSAKIIKSSTLPCDVQTESTESKSNVATEIVYIPIYMESYYESEIVTEADNESEYIIKLYDDRIGVFTDDGRLIQVIDVYTKTLPKRDQDLLEKGFNIKSKDLNKLIEDYTGWTTLRQRYLFPRALLTRL